MRLVGVSLGLGFVGLDGRGFAGRRLLRARSVHLVAARLGRLALAGGEGEARADGEEAECGDT